MIHHVEIGESLVIRHRAANALIGVLDDVAGVLCPEALHRSGIGLVAFLRTDVYRDRKLRQRLIDPGITRLIAAHEAVPPLVRGFVNQQKLEKRGVGVPYRRIEHELPRILHAACAVGRLHDVQLAERVRAKGRVEDTQRVLGSLQTAARRGDGSRIARVVVQRDPHPVLIAVERHESVAGGDHEIAHQRRDELVRQRAVFVGGQADCAAAGRDQQMRGSRDAHIVKRGFTEDDIALRVCGFVPPARAGFVDR